MDVDPELVLIGSVAAVGVLHTLVPDHWMPIALIARQRGWSKLETARASLQAGIGHVISTLLIASVVWIAGVVVAKRFGHFIGTTVSLALVGFGAWIAISAWRELNGGIRHEHTPETVRSVHTNVAAGVLVHKRSHNMAGRTALLLILGSSPMVEGIPAFFAASKYGIGLLLVMSIVFAVSTIATYVLLCVYSTLGLQRVRLSAFERYGEVLSGVFVAAVGLVFWIWPVL